MSKTSARPETTTGTTSATRLLDRWLAHHEGEQPGDAPAAGTEVHAPAGTIGQDPVAEVAAPPVTDAPSAIEAGRAVLEAFNHERLEVPATPVVAASAAPETVEAATTSPTPPTPGHLGSAAGAPSPQAREGRPASTPPRDGRSAPGTTRASAAAIRETTPVNRTVPPTVAPAPAQAPTPIRRPPVAPAPGVVLTSPSRGGRRALTVLALAAAAGTAVAGWAVRSASAAERTTSVAIAAGLALLTLLLWSARGRQHPTVVTVENDTLRIVRGPSRHEFPLAGPHPPIDILGEPDDRGWKVLIQRRSMSPYVVTRSMVDPQAFTELIRRYRPNA